VLLAADKKAVDPHGWHRLVERDGVGPVEQDAQYDVGFEASQGSTDAVVDPTTECQMAFQDAPLEVDVVGVVAPIGVPVGRTPERDHGGSTCSRVRGSLNPTIHLRHVGLKNPRYESISPRLNALAAAWITSMGLREIRSSLSCSDAALWDKRPLY
jgi:hypothetical protein